jgi:tRNA(Ile)-lysidine synthase
MASSRKSNLTDIVAAHLAPLLPQHSHILIGLSGGMDSVVLLHLLHTLAPRFEWRISAQHVHHGISPNADAWATFCVELCARFDIPLRIERVNIAPLRADHGIEAAARKLRLASLAKQNCDCVALAHHADDQVETLLLQLLRGAGIRGVAAMPLYKPATTHAPATMRPLLGIPHSILLEYAVQQSLQWVEDESNADDNYPRNFLRHRLLPMLEQKFPAYRGTLTRSAQNFGEAGELLDELAQLDAHGTAGNVTLDISLLRPHSHSRAKNLLRYFLHTQGAPMPQAVQIDEMLYQLLEGREDAAVCIDFGGWQVRRYQDKVYAFPALVDINLGLVIPWLGEPELQWPVLNKRIAFSQAQGVGIRLAKLQLAPVTLRIRSGGESLRPHPNAATRSLKNLLQEHHVPPWLRERMPLLYCGGELVSVVGVAVSAEYQARNNENGLLVSCE